MIHTLILSQDLVSLDWTLLAELIAFLILMYVLVRILYTPVSAVMIKRADTIRDGLAAAEAARKAAVEAQSRTDEQLEQSKAQAQEILRQATATAGSMREQIIAEARAEAQKVIERGKGEIDRERQAAVDELRRVVADVAILAATRIVEKSLDTADNRKLIDDAIAQTSSFASAGRN